MNIKTQIEAYLASLPEPKRDDMRSLHRAILRAVPRCRLWFLDGKDAKGKIVSNPNIGYGEYVAKYADGTTKDFFRIGLSANTAGISVYLMGIPDKAYLAKAYGKTIGKAKVTGYCIKFKALKDIDIETLTDAVRYGAGLGR